MLNEIRRACAGIESATAKCVNRVFIRRDAWPAFKAELAKLATKETDGKGPYMFFGVTLHVVDWPLPQPWCTDADLGDLGAAAKYIRPEMW